jgi:glutamate-1-semialdehyde 2,1-aminomutase
MTTTLDQLLSDYRDKNGGSYQLWRRAHDSMPGGNTRTGVHVDPFPIYTERGEGVHVTDVDGNERTDFVCNATALILGHAHPDVVSALQSRAAMGTAFFGPTPIEVELAELVRERLPSLEKIRYCSSGTEAVLNALRVARAFTGRPLIAKFEGAYHGIDDPALVSYVPPLTDELGPANQPNPVLSSKGLAPGTAESVLVLPYNDAEVAEALIRANGDQIAAIIIDPLSTAAGLALPDQAFIDTLRRVATELDIVLIFDEIVSFRAGPSGTQGVYGITPDLTCLAKVVAGGTPGGLFGGRADIMSLYDPTTGTPAIPQSGTYNGNPLVASAGFATLQGMTPAAYSHIENLTHRISDGVRAAFADSDASGCVVNAGSLFRIYFLDKPPTNYREAAEDSKARHRWLYFYLLNNGILSRQGGCVPVPLTDAQADQFIQTVATGLKEMPADL